MYARFVSDAKGAEYPDVDLKLSLNEKPLRHKNGKLID